MPADWKLSLDSPLGTRYRSTVPRPSRSSTTNAIPDLEHDAIAVALQEELGARVLLLKVIGQGGMGRVYLGRDPQLKRFVAVKVLVQAHGADAEAHARFRREAQAIAAVSHPNVVGIYGVGELPDGTPYFVMQYISGGSMAERLFASGPLRVDVAEGVLGDVAAALAAAHKRGIVHRDVKPANVLWDEENERATVSDFGIAAVNVGDDEGDIRITGSGMAVGSPAYMSPEQLLTEPVTPKSDIYALGLLGYELLTAHGPYKTSSPNELVAAHLRDTPRRITELRPDVSPSLETLLLRCLEKRPEDRPTAEEVMLALAPGAAEALEWPPPGLERAEGALWRLMLSFTVGTVLLLFPLLLLVKGGRVGVGEGDGTVLWPLVLGASSLIGFTAFARGVLRAWRLGATIARAARLGYGWGTLVEVMADRRGDTGAVIAGTYEYTALSFADRSRLRILRVVEAISLLLATPVALIVAILTLALRGGQPRGDAVLINAVLVSILGCAACGIVAAGYERMHLHTARRKRSEFPHHTSERELAPAWYAAFERSREGQSFGAGSPVGRVVAVLLTTVGTFAVFSCATVILVASLITYSGQILDEVIGTRVSALLTFNAQRVAGGTSYRVPPDGRTTPIDAGSALLAVASTYRVRPPSAIERRDNVVHPRWRRVVPPPAMFPKPMEMLWTSAAIRAAGTGLSPDQRALLQQASSHPATAEFSRATLASSLDLYGALLNLPLKARIHPSTYPRMELNGVRIAAESHAALVALDVADHRPQDAERHAREIITIGAMLLDVHILRDNLAGIGLLKAGLGTLESVYIATGREREARVLLDSIVSASNRQNQVPVRSTNEELQRAMHNKQFLRGARMEMVIPLLFRACTDPKQLLFGVDDAFRRTVTYARDSLAEHPSEKAFIDAWDGMLSIGAVSLNSERRGALSTMAHLIDGVVSGTRFESCVSMTPSLAERW